MSKHPYIWQRTRSALQALASTPTEEAIQHAAADLAILHDIAPISDPEIVRSWNRATEILKHRPLTQEQKLELLDHLWRVFEHAAGVP